MRRRPLLLPRPLFFERLSEGVQENRSSRSGRDRGSAIKLHFYTGALGRRAHRKLDRPALSWMRQVHLYCHALRGGLCAAMPKIQWACLDVPFRMEQRGACVRPR